MTISTTKLNVFAAVKTVLCNVNKTIYTFKFIFNSFLVLLVNKKKKNTILSFLINFSEVRVCIVRTKCNTFFLRYFQITSIYRINTILRNCFWWFIGSSFLLIDFSCHLKYWFFLIYNYSASVAKLVTYP